MRKRHGFVDVGLHLASATPRAGQVGFSNVRFIASVSAAGCPGTPEVPIAWSYLCPVAALDPLTELLW